MATVQQYTQRKEVVAHEGQAVAVIPAPGAQVCVGHAEATASAPAAHASRASLMSHIGASRIQHAGRDCVLAVSTSANLHADLLEPRQTDVIVA